VASAGTGRIDIEDIEIAFGRGASAHSAVARTSFAVEPGEFICLLGPSGCGKSTLLNAIAGYIRPDRGRILVDGGPVTAPGPDRGMVFQQYSLFPWKTVRENVAFGPRIAGRPTREAREIADRFLGMVGLARFGDRYPAELSGGMQQRVGIARALANRPSVLLMDEPFGALDAQTRQMMQESLTALWSDFGTTVVFVTHDVDEAIFLADRVLVMSAGPGRVIADIAIGLGRPRTAESTGDPRYLALRQECRALIRSESLKAFEEQNR
jgi:NitT/TauT family transport system ATP-binding protein